jgi:TonB family protein
MMKKYLLTLLSFLFLAISAKAQEPRAPREKPSIILDGILLINKDTLQKIDRNSIESVTVLKEKTKTALFGINNDNGLLIIITKAHKNSAENIALKEKIAKLDIATKPNMVFRETLKKPSRDSIPNGTFDFVSVEKQPEFPGGISAFYQYLSRNIKYPKEARRDKIQGKVFLSFIVEKDGRLTAIKITRGLSAETNAEALRVVSASPNWSPGIQFGVPVRVKYNINVNFALK